MNFNPRSLAGATADLLPKMLPIAISIHAPSRERRLLSKFLRKSLDFNPRSLAGATYTNTSLNHLTRISIHAPSRERLRSYTVRSGSLRFQSTLPRGSDVFLPIRAPAAIAFQSTLPRGSDLDFYWPSFAHLGISIHAPSRERPSAVWQIVGVC